MAGSRDLKLDARRVLPAHLFTLRFSRSGGPGGQNVNKVATKVDLRLDLDGAAAILGELAVARLRSRLTNRLDSDGRLHVVASEYRDQARNIDAAYGRMRALILGGLTRPKSRVATRPTRASRERRINEKKKRAEVKKRRGNVDGD